MTDYTLNIDPLEEAMLDSLQCPACMHVNTQADIVGHYRQVSNTLVNGDFKQIADVQRVRCQRCGSAFENKTYL